MLRNAITGTLSRQLRMGLPTSCRYLAAQKAPTDGAPSAAAATPVDDSALNEPVKYFGSKAATWRAKDTRSGGAEEALWYQPYVISGSLAIFLIYFCILREESDIDLKLGGQLYDHVSGLEELQLTVAYKYNRENNLDTKELEQRLAELGIDVKRL